MQEEEQLSTESHVLEASTNPSVVYDRVTRAWQLILGEDLHFGYFENPAEPLSIATARLTHEMADWASLRTDMELLDVGCGIGGPALFLAQHLRCHVTGISTSPVGIDLASRRAMVQALSDRTAFFERDGMANGFPDSSFDCVWIMESSHLMPDKHLLMSESARVLRPGGCQVLCDLVVHSSIPFQRLVRNFAEFENLNKVFGKQHVDVPETYKKSAENCGLTVERFEDISQAVFPTLEHWRRNANGNREELVELVGDEYMSRFIRACGFLETLWEDHTLGYGMMLARKKA